MSAGIDRHFWPDFRPGVYPRGPAALNVGAASANASESPVPLAARQCRAVPSSQVKSRNDFETFLVSLEISQPDWYVYAKSFSHAFDGGSVNSEDIGLPRATTHGLVPSRRVPLEEQIEAAGIANYKVPKRIVFVDQFPEKPGPNGVKILKTKLREMAAAELSL